ncbi:MAG: peptidoglycan DD-metalloendopeptidase family protein [Caldilineaceae bacterium]|nr:peptidoglycan DD-metalloendopeptidase family protein [Caldilineaceae bacterium]
MYRRIFAIAFGICALAGFFFFAPTTATAQSGATYTVQPGDTLGEIATRFGTSVEALAAANNITNVNVLAVGQVLVIPGAPQMLPFVTSYPGETLEDVAGRWGLPADQLAAINEVDLAVRLFPGQPIYLPPSIPAGETLRFGVVTELDYPAQIVQGQTGWLSVQSRRPISLTVEWNGLPLAMAAHPLLDGEVRYTAHIPVPALLGPGPFPLDVSYPARNGVRVRHTTLIDIVSGGYPSQAINLPPDRGALLAPALVQAELITVTTAWSATDTPIQWSGPFLRPIAEEYQTTSAYGIRRSYDGGPYNNYHAGQDFGAPVGVMVTAPAAGIVALAEPLVVRGNVVILDHGRGVFTGYWHLSDILVEAGQQVDTGDLLGLVGNTGLSTGAHLHWELRIYGIAVDPMQFLTAPLFPE